MCERAHESTPASEVDADPTDTGTYDGFRARLSSEVRDVLAAHARTKGASAAWSEAAAAYATAVVDALTEQAWRERQRARQRAARAAGMRAGTVCGRWRGERRVPDLRLTGRWLEVAGFGVGREFVVEVGEGRLVVLAL